MKKRNLKQLRYIISDIQREISEYRDVSYVPRSQLIAWANDLILILDDEANSENRNTDHKGGHEHG